MTSDAPTTEQPDVAGLHVLYVIDSLHHGGAERSLAAMAPHFVRRGVRLDVAFLHDRQGSALPSRRRGRPCPT